MYVGSEVGRLHRVLLHRPGAELSRLTPRNCHELLFDEVPWQQRAAEEHDAFSAVLRQRGVDVVYLVDLIEQALRDPAARAFAVESALNTSGVSSPCRAVLANYLIDMDESQLTGALISGVTFGELPELSGWTASLVNPGSFIITPAPNQVFVRDTSAVLYERLCLPTMARLPRQRESLIAQLAHSVLQPERAQSSVLRARVEGGDIMILGNGHLLIGVSERSNANAVMHLAEEYLATRPECSVVATMLPQGRWAMHLDTVLTMVSHDRVLAYSAIASHLRGIQLRRRRHGIECVADGALFDVLARVLGLPSLEILGPSADSGTLEREQWDDAYNVLAIAPNVVISYERNFRSNEQLSHAGLDVLTIPGSELGRGRGGPRCMSCPIEREA